ncbi:MAG: hypothetical protein KAQ83_04765, partial [Nanoarchaeota archaeon]|nr:hypothetical protein [Nanoarchaeota archaeon]
MDAFLNRKKVVLSKMDKSSKGSIDEKIKKICDIINEKEEYFTTSSCSGRLLTI